LISMTPLSTSLNAAGDNYLANQSTGVESEREVRTASEHLENEMEEIKADMREMKGDICAMKSDLRQMNEAQSASMNAIHALLGKILTGKTDSGAGLRESVSAQQSDATSPKRCAWRFGDIGDSSMSC